MTMRPDIKLPDRLHIHLLQMKPEFPIVFLSALYFQRVDPRSKAARRHWEPFVFPEAF